MTWSTRVVWLEGMFLRAQHFQQQDRWLETLVRDRTASLRPHGWGLTEAAINRNLRGTGQFALASGSGVFEDGTPFALPGETDQPVPLDLPETTRNAIVYLVLPMRQAGSVEVSANGSSEGRYEQRGFEAYASHYGAAARLPQRQASVALQPRDRKPPRLTRHRPRPRRRGRRRPPGGPGRSMDP